jgi:RNA polymerase sigma-B factor
LSSTLSGHRVSDDELIERYQQRHDLGARSELVERYLPFARKLATRYSYTDEPLEDLVQVAAIGLMGALERFDPSRGAKFTTFAAPTILGELKRHFRDKGWTLHVPRDLQERALALSRTSERLANELGRSPTVPEQVLEASEVAHSYTPASLDAPVVADEQDSGSLVEMLGRDDDAFDLVERRLLTQEVWQTMPELEREVVALRFARGLTQREIGQRIGYSQMHVSRLLRRALARILAAREQSA